MLGAITCVISKAVEDRLRTYIWHRYGGKGKHVGEVIEAALTEFLDLHEGEVAQEET